MQHQLVVTAYSKALIGLLLTQHGLLLDDLPDWLGGLEGVQGSRLHLILLLAEVFVDGLEHVAGLIDIIEHLLSELDVLRADFA